MEGVSARTHPRQELRINLSRDHPLVGSPQRRFKEPLGRTRPLSLDRPHVNPRRYGALKRWLSEEVSGVIREEEEESAEGAGSEEGAPMYTASDETFTEDDKRFTTSLADTVLTMLSNYNDRPQIKTEIKFKVCSFLANLRDTYAYPRHNCPYPT